MKQRVINDSLGHSVGDKLLQSVASRLAYCVRLSDTVSRLGGDEFVVLLSEVAQAEDAALTARRILQAIQEVHHIDHHELHASTSIGISVYPDTGLTRRRWSRMRTPPCIRPRKMAVIVTNFSRRR